MVKYVSGTKAGRAIAAYVILNRKGIHVATVKAHYSDGGVCLVNIHDSKAGFQSGRAGGYGYDKFTAALSGLTIDGHELSNHCGGEAKRPARGYWLKTDKIPRGYSIANWTQFDVASKRPIHSYDWQDKARAQLGDSADWKAVKALAVKLESEAAARGETASGYDSCFRESGLKYLESLGYRVIQAI